MGSSAFFGHPSWHAKWRRADIGTFETYVFGGWLIGESQVSIDTDAVCMLSSG